MPARQHRITRGDDYRRIVRNGKPAGGQLCITHAMMHDAGAERSPARFGFIVSKAVGNAVTRNLVRRRLKAIVERRLSDGFTGADVVFRALPMSATAHFEDLELEVIRGLDRAQKSPRKTPRSMSS